MIVAVIVILTILFALVLAVVFGVATNHGPGPADVALGYEHAWNELDFVAIWMLSGGELRDGLNRKDFVAAKRAAYATQRLHALAEDILLEQIATQGDAAVAQTLLILRDGQEVRNDLHLECRHGSWVVVAYSLYDGSPSKN